MDSFITGFLALELSIIFGTLIALVYLIKKRIKDKTSEDFGNRSN